MYDLVHPNWIGATLIKENANLTLAAGPQIINFISFDSYRQKNWILLSMYLFKLLFEII